MLNNTQPNTLKAGISSNNTELRTKQLRKMPVKTKKNYIENKGKEAKEATKVNDNRKLYDITRSLSGKSSKTLQQLRT